MDSEYPQYVRVRAGGSDLDFDSCPGQSCDGEMVKDGSFLNLSGTGWECQSCGVQYHTHETRRVEEAKIVPDSTDSDVEYQVRWSPEQEDYFDI